MPSVILEHTGLQTATQDREATPLLPSSSVEEVSNDRKSFVKVAVCVAVLTFASGFEVTAVATVGPVIGRELGVESLSPLLGTVFLLFSMLSTLISAQGSNVFGRRLTTTIGCAFYAMGTLMCTVSTTAIEIFVGRAISGFGIGCITVMSSVILSETVPLKSRALWHSVGKLVAGMAMSVGGPIGGWISDKFTWRAVFWIQVPLAVISVALASYSIRDKRAPHQSSTSTLDVVGFFLFTIGLATVFLSLSGGSSILDLSKVMRLFLGAAGCLAVVALCYRCASTGRSPVSIRLFKSRNVVSIFLMIFISSMIHQSILYNVPLFAAYVSHMPAAAAGLSIMPISMAAILATLVAGLRISRSGKYRRMMSVSVIFVTLGPLAFVCVSLLSPSAPFDMIMEVASSFPSTFGFQLLNAVSIVALLASGDSDIAELTSHATLSKSFGGVIGTGLSGFLLQTFISDCVSERSQYDGAWNFSARKGVETGLQDNANSFCWRSGFGRLFAILAAISIVNIGLIYFVDDEVDIA